jgi:RNA polymerase sigma factor (TIGR02999 family)
MKSSDGPQEQGASGRPDDRDRLDSRVSDLYDRLRTLARRCVQGKSGRRVLDPTELVHECYLKLAKHGWMASLPHQEFLALAATAIRTVLVDHARELATLKRGGGAKRVTLDGNVLARGETIDLVSLDAALTKLGALDARLARVVELRFFGGLEIDEVAAALGVSARTVNYDWTLAKAWLHRELELD